MLKPSKTIEAKHLAQLEDAPLGAVQPWLWHCTNRFFMVFVYKHLPRSKPSKKCWNIDQLSDVWKFWNSFESGNVPHFERKSPSGLSWSRWASLAWWHTEIMPRPVVFWVNKSHNIHSMYRISLHLYTVNVCISTTWPCHASQSIFVWSVSFCSLLKAGDQKRLIAAVNGSPGDDSRGSWHWFFQVEAQLKLQKSAVNRASFLIFGTEPNTSTSDQLWGLGQSSNRFLLHFCLCLAAAQSLTKATGRASQRLCPRAGSRLIQLRLGMVMLKQWYMTHSRWQKKIYYKP